MHTLPNRSVNTFQSAGVRRSSLTGMRYPRSSSLYLPQNDANDESRSQLLPNEPYPGERRTQTLGRSQQHHGHAPPSSCSRNMTNPLFDSATSLDQPWYRGYGQPVSLSPPQINLPDQPMDSTSGYGTVREMQSTIRVPSTRSPGRTSAYSTSRRLDEHSQRGCCADTVAPKRNWMGCAGFTCCEKEPR
ncbi:unnamed protein product [Echinostoma caproni]|uniref:Uncharacterized protein n=1 Tax=Echinostoma caproni TaxID=27848 RepID=A0A183A747_9TREM|nr:unnamed protein product [Echinostoma caproni]